jgi:hypothetical protein
MCSLFFTFTAAVEFALFCYIVELLLALARVDCIIAGEGQAHGLKLLPHIAAEAASCSGRFLIAASETAILEQPKNSCHHQ